MSTESADLRVRGGASAAGRSGRRGLTDDAAAQLALIVGFVVLLATTAAAQLLLDNTYGPLGEHEAAGNWAALGGGVVAGVVAVAATQLLALRSGSAVTALLVAAALAWVVLFPRAIDVSESWVPRPNERHSCTGWTFRHYPPGTMDASSTTYCVGFEHRIADG